MPRSSSPPSGGRSSSSPRYEPLRTAKKEVVDKRRRVLAQKVLEHALAVAQQLVLGLVLFKQRHHVVGEHSRLRISQLHAHSGERAFY